MAEALLVLKPPQAKPAEVIYTIAILVKDGIQSAMTLSCLAALRDIGKLFEVVVLYDDLPMQLEGAILVLDYFGIHVSMVRMKGASIVAKCNKALELAKGIELIFLDDDMLVTADTIKQLTRRADFGVPFIMTPALSPKKYPFRCTSVQYKRIDGVRPYFYDMPVGMKEIVACGWTNTIAIHVPAFQSVGGFQLPRPPFPWMSDIHTTLLVAKRHGPGLVLYGYPAFQCERQVRYASPEETKVREEIDLEIHLQAEAIERSYRG